MFGKIFGKKIVRKVLEPILSRVGTAAGTYLITIGMSADTAQNVVTALTALGLFLGDLVTRLIFKRGL